jgi:hypothetical protein
VRAEHDERLEGLTGRIVEDVDHQLRVEAEALPGDDGLGSRDEGRGGDEVVERCVRSRGSSSR